jgi:hypothetical protein
LDAGAFNTAARWRARGLVEAGAVAVMSAPGAAPLRYTVNLISDPQTNPQQWTVFGRDDNGQQHTSTFGENELVRRYTKAS